MPADDGYLDLDAAARFVGIAPGELDKLARAGAVQRENGRFHPLRLVRGYVEDISISRKRIMGNRCMYRSPPRLGSGAKR
uniref:Uncharacterized protein n=1 Tax=Candidatus Kentrum eta TaxID=2126337 RepID=A0A450UJD9_9GAMM|nr:MAG: hypothetical protein BECKH772A_GA0070896_100324 [Candidatus Kentron sp. H]VFJ92614.1 MAG: hypothetical protein BECKH772B_GA0070898_1003131 [Candidatus Kentron sp. H]VFJ99328.1 MAG: hypothetical protein BECKH772C_GA0070978_100315 [Candidatus Kentron sp. H]